MNNAANDPKKLMVIISDMRQNPQNYTAKQRTMMAQKMGMKPDLFKLEDRVEFMPRTVSDMGGEIPDKNKAMIEALLQTESGDPEAADKYKVAQNAMIDSLNRGADYGKVQPYLLKLREAQAQMKNKFKSGFGTAMGEETPDIRTGEMQNNPVYFEKDRKTFRTYDPQDPEDLKGKIENSYQKASFPLLEEPVMERMSSNMPKNVVQRFEDQKLIDEAQKKQDFDLYTEGIKRRDLFDFLNKPTEA